jgi:hypothetical protein
VDVIDIDFLVEDFDVVPLCSLHDGDLAKHTKPFRKENLITVLRAPLQVPRAPAYRPVVRVLSVYIHASHLL